MPPNCNMASILGIFYIPGCHSPQIRQNLSFIFYWEESLHILTFKSCPYSKPVVPSIFLLSPALKK